MFTSSPAAVFSTAAGEASMCKSGSAPMRKLEFMWHQFQDLGEVLIHFAGLRRGVDLVHRASLGPDWAF